MVFPFLPEITWARLCNDDRQVGLFPFLFTMTTAGNLPIETFQHTI